MSPSYFKQILVSFEGDTLLKKVNVFDKIKQESRQIDIDGVFIEIGNIPNSFLAKDLVSLNEQKEIIVNDLLETQQKAYMLQVTLLQCLTNKSSFQ